MNLLALGLSDACHHMDALSVREAQLSELRRVGAPEHNMPVVQGNLAVTYHLLKRFEEALRLRRDVYSGHLKLCGEENRLTLIAANNYALSLLAMQQFEEAKSLMRKVMPMARRARGEGDSLTLTIRWTYAKTFYLDPGATLDDLREAVTTLEEIEPIARRVLGGSHPDAVAIHDFLRRTRAALRSRETLSSSSEAS